jgi:hypothetical protein
MIALRQCDPVGQTPGGTRRRGYAEFGQRDRGCGDAPRAGQDCTLDEQLTDDPQTRRHPVMRRLLPQPREG